MPTAKEVAQQLQEGWTLEDQVDELRGKYHLKKKDHEAYRESSVDEIREVEQNIGQLRHANLNKRTLVAQHENGDERVIKTVFRNDHKERLSLQRLTASRAIEEMDQRVCESAKFLNNLRYEREKRENKLQELLQEEEHYKVSLGMKADEETETNATLTLLENNLDKANIKYDTARIITRRYQEILEKMKEESKAMPAKLDAMEETLKHQGQELKSLRATCKSAIAARDATKKDLSKVEQEAYMARKSRDQELSALRKEVERRKAEAEKVERRYARATLLSDNQDIKAQQELQRKRDRQQKILSYEEAYRRIKETTHVTDMDEVVQRVLHQETKQQHLNKQISELDVQRQRLSSELEKFLQQYHDMKYSGEQKESRSQRLLSEINIKLDTDNRKLQKTIESNKNKENLLVNVSAGINAILSKLDEVKLRPPEHNYTKGDTFQSLELACKKLDKLLHEVNVQSDCSQAEENFKNKLESSDFHDFLEGQLPMDNIRIRLNKQDSRLSTLSDFDFDGQEQEQALGRNDLKKLGMKLIESKTRKAKKKSKK